MSVTSGFVALWLYVASSGLMALLRNVKIHKNSYLKEKVLRSCRDPNGKVISVLEISRTVPGYHRSLTSNLRSFSAFWFGALPLQLLGGGRREEAGLAKLLLLSECLPHTLPAGIPFLSSGPAPLENRLGYVSAR